MSGHDPGQQPGQDPGPSSSSSRPKSTIPNQPYQILGANYTFTPYYTTSEGANRLHPTSVTPHLHNDLHHPPQEFPVPRNQFPATDPITESRKGDGERTGELSYDQVAAMKDVKDLTKEERHACDANEFSATPPEELSPVQKQRWTQLHTEIFATKDNEEDEQLDPYKMRPRGELRKLKHLADLAGGKFKPAESTS